MELHEKIRAYLREVDKLASEYQSQKPFSHIVLDDFLPPQLAEAALEAFPDVDSPIWNALPTEDQRFKLATKREEDIPPPLRAIIHELNSGAFLNLLEKLTGIPDLIADTKCVGGGLHQIKRGGKLAVHIDFSHHPGNDLYRRVNLLLYLNKDWSESYQGNLEFWDSKVTRCEKKILPIFNRCALFSTTDSSYHGHPEPLACPEDKTRKSISLYYFTKNPPVGKEMDLHNTLFKSRPQDRFHLSNFLARIGSSEWFRDLMPPVLYRALRRAWNRKVTAED